MSDMFDVFDVFEAAAEEFQELFAQTDDLTYCLNQAAMAWWIHPLDLKDFLDMAS